MRENTLSSFHNQNVVTLKRSIREKLKRPLGKIFYSVDDAIKHGKFMRNQKHALITVGDRTTINFISNNLIPDLTIIDGLEISVTPEVFDGINNEQYNNEYINRTIL